MFAYRLAGHLGKTVGELRETMDADEFAEWVAVDQLSPIGGERADLLHAFASALFANANSKKRWQPKHFLPKWGREKRGSSPDEIRAYFAAMKGRDNDG